MRVPPKLVIFFEKTIKTAILIVFNGFKCKNGCKSVDLQPFCRGAAGSRTPVQTRKQYAFYMLIQDLVFE